MKVPACPDLDVGLGHGFSLEGWINPATIPTNASLVVTGATIMSDGFENYLPRVCQSIGAGADVSGWHVDSGNVDDLYAGCGFLAPGTPDTGQRCLDLNGSTAGSISRSFNTLPGKDYLLTLAYCKNPSPAQPPGFVATANINITGQPTIT